MVLKAGKLETKIRDITDTLVALIDEKAKAAGERAAGLQREADSLRKQAEDEGLARVQLEKLVGWRTITPKQQRQIGSRLKAFPGIRIAFTFNAGDPEGLAFATQIASTAIEANWGIIAFAAVTNLGRPRTGVEVTTTGDRNTMDASDALVHELNRLHFAATRSPEIDPRTTDPLRRPLMYVLVNLRPQAVPNKVSQAIAAQK